MLTYGEEQKGFEQSFWWTLYCKKWELKGGTMKIHTNEGLASQIHEGSSVFRWEKASSDKMCTLKSENSTLSGSNCQDHQSSFCDVYLLFLSYPGVQQRMNETPEDLLSIWVIHYCDPVFDRRKSGQRFTGLLTVYVEFSTVNYK